jgi:hypothetical protein
MLGRSTPAGGCSNVSAGFFSLQFLAKLVLLFGHCFSGASICGAEF